MRKILFVLLFVFILIVSTQAKGISNSIDRFLLTKESGRSLGGINLDDSYLVSRVVDGDTIDVIIDNKTKRIRIIGLDTPEVVDPRREVECFGPEASKHAKELLENKYVRLEIDSTQDNKDKYGRLLRHVVLADGKRFAEIMISQGYAHEYTYNKPCKYQKEYLLAEAEAKQESLGMWAEGACK